MLSLRWSLQRHSRSFLAIPKHSSCRLSAASLFSTSSVLQKYIKAVSSSYEKEHLDQYLQLIGYNQRYGESREPNLLNLTRISRLHQVTFPFENTEMHFNPDRWTDVSSEGVFQRMVQRRQGGAFCIGLNTVLLNMLRAFGYRSYSVSGRINRDMNQPDRPAVYGPLSHMLLLVKVEDRPEETYVVDAGFGGSGIVRPSLLIDGTESEGMTSFEKYRLVKAPPPAAGSDGASMWIIQQTQGEHVNIPNAPLLWKSLFAFTEAEASMEDHENSAFITAMMPRPNIFQEHIVCVQYFVTEDTKHLPIEEAKFGRYIMFKTAVTKTIGAQNEIVKVLGSERDRVEALRHYFNIHVEEAHIRNIETRPGSLANYLKAKVKPGDASAGLGSAIPKASPKVAEKAAPAAVPASASKSTKQVSSMVP